MEQLDWSGGPRGEQWIVDLDWKSRLGQIWRKLMTSLKHSDYILEVMGSHGRLFRREVAGREQED